MALEQNKQCFLHRGLCPQTPGVFSLAIQGVTFHLLLSKKRATPGWCYSPHSTTLRFGTLSSVAHTLMWHIDHISASAPVQSPLKHLHLLLPAFQVARFTRSAPHRHLLFQVTSVLQSATYWTTQNNPLYLSASVLYSVSSSSYSHPEITGSFPVPIIGLMDPGYCQEQ